MSEIGYVLKLNIIQLKFCSKTILKIKKNSTENKNIDFISINQMITPFASNRWNLM
jgi:hypothetical protein